ncbi:hypothetical protein CS022_12390 [Veronia nyctiphanis]|uniref:Beta-lactamase-related domain-containing protein n=1 Tax=Veronia nyctiphanis TaxID=1278244 RepID=A0A4Q0YPS7_9GAMM|nr:serine hydrolase domain-containing protein [Veronia nyctiphanis]RXJ73070.1 hypothetical protein CS022_12390 [Veronia nyctiphanis]
MTSSIWHEVSTVATEVSENNPQVADSQAMILNRYFSELAKHKKYLGSAAIYQNGMRQYHHTLGLNENGETVSSEQTLRYRIGSITKTFTSVLIFTLIEKGMLCLETKLSTFYPNIPHADSIAIAQLLGHTSGVKSFTNVPDFEAFESTRQDVETIIQWIESLEPQFDPGRQAEYSNSNYYLLGQIIEIVTAENYQQNLKKYITDKLGLMDTYFGGDINTDSREVHSYKMQNNQWIQISKPAHMSVPHGAGAVISSTHDLSVFIHALFSGQLISESSLQSMFEIQNDMGKGIFKSEVNGRVVYGHTGSIDDFISLLFYDFESKVSVCVLANGAVVGPRAIADELLAAAYGEEVTLPDFSCIKLSGDELSHYTGKYTSETAPVDIDIFIHGSTLMLQMTGEDPAPLVAKSTAEFEFLEHPVSVVFEAGLRQFTLKQGIHSDIFVWHEPCD